VVDTGIHAPHNNINGYELVLEEWKRLTIIRFWCHSNVGEGTWSISKIVHTKTFVKE